MEFDPNKDAKNSLKRGLPFERAHDFDFATAIYLVDERHRYEETRRIAVGYLDGRLHILCFVDTKTGIRVISFRKANAREVRDMAKRKSLTDAAGEVRELSNADLTRGKSISGLPKSLQTKLRKVGERGPQKTPTKKLVSLRLSPEVLAHYKASGPGWQTRIDQALKRAVAKAR